MTGAVARIAEQRVLPVLRSASPEDAVATAEACMAAGMSVVELTRSTPRVEDALRALSGRDARLGVGTVTSAEQVRASADAGASFIVSFTLIEEVVSTALDLGLEVVPGALSPTEMLTCRAAGASGVKLFPARAVPPGYVRDLLTVMPDLQLVCTGGISADRDEIGPWLDAGAIAVGLGGDLGTAAEQGQSGVEARCRAALAAASPPPAAVRTGQA